MTVVILLFLFSQASTHDLEGSVYCVQEGETRRLSDFGAATPAWSPNGEMICYVRHTDDGNVFYFISPAGEPCRLFPCRWRLREGFPGMPMGRLPSLHVRVRRLTSTAWTLVERQSCSYGTGFYRPGLRTGKYWPSLQGVTGTRKYTLQTMKDTCGI